MYTVRWRKRLAGLLLVGLLSLLAACRSQPSPMPTLISSPMAASSSPSPIPPARTEVPTNTGAPTETAGPSHLASDTPGAPNPQPTISEPSDTETALPTQPPIAHIAAGQPLTITSIHMTDAATGWAITIDTVGIAHILRTADSGSGWHDVTPPQAGFSADDEANWLPSSATDFLDANNAWAIYWDDPNQPKTVWRTRDGGEAWENSQLPATNGDDYGQAAFLHFVDARNGWLLTRPGACGTVCDYSVVFATTDGGQTWQRVVGTWEGGLSDCAKYGLAFVSPRTGWVSGFCYAAYVYLLQRTDDGGHTWRLQTLPPPSEAPNLLWDGDPNSLCHAFGPVFTSPLAGFLDMDCQWAKPDSLSWTLSSRER